MRLTSTSLGPTKFGTMTSLWY